ncbi:MAG: hypothetical protein IJN12_01780 [Clostridia bacterium]|nr:hypothetical protein [Clostridia bacterium]
MIRSGFTDILSYFEDAAFPVILLKPDLTVEYMNRQADNKFGKYLRIKNWQSEYMHSATVRKITTSILAGENVIVSPPDVKEFSFLLFQPILGQSGKPELVRLNIEILADMHKKYRKNSPNINLFSNIYNETHRQLSTIEMSIEALRRSICKDGGDVYLEMLKSSSEVFSKIVMTYDYIYSLMKSYNINEETLFDPSEVVEKLAESNPKLSVINLLSGYDVLICNPQLFINTLKAIIEHITIFAEDSQIELKAYEEKEHFVFVLKANKDQTPKSHYNYIQQYYMNLEPFKEKAEELGGNLIKIENEAHIKIMYSLRKHFRMDSTVEFNQDTSFESPYQI